MRKIIMILLLVACSLIVVSTLVMAGTLQHESSNREDAIQMFAPRGDSTVTLAASGSTTANLTGRVMYGINSTAACIFRGMTSATKKNTPANVGANTPYVRAVNKATPFLNISGCVGDLTVQ